MSIEMMMDTSSAASAELNNMQQQQEQQLDRNYYIQFYTQKLSAMAIERQISSLSHIEQLLNYQTELVPQLIHTELISSSSISSLLTEPCLKCLKSLLFILTTTHILIQQQEKKDLQIVEQGMIHNEQAILAYFLEAGCKTNTDMINWLRKIQEKSQMAQLAPEQQQEEAKRWYQVLERYFEPVLFPELSETFVNAHTRPSMNTCSIAEGKAVDFNVDKKAFIFMLYEFVDAIHTILKIRK
ncbi:predicted protein [Naegleria gruberi]|uniref:Predicted protein n=1 Tax=Naegleria gruberi TaxID=5762 RepID=D2VPZ1_NAEGR|nr:uncharacterized protein NAEGRDRAFT_71105 [Naegleria gruberi]EFC41016.1 predicted protein [Naegleria gruberi]|eukprot:XP_002673760.1 predicted protein [Naegleria gruberi strain NEG-M]